MRVTSALLGRNPAARAVCANRPGAQQKYPATIDRSGMGTTQMAKNFKGRSINYTPRMTDAEAFDLLPAQVKRALQEAVTSWSSYGALRHCRKFGWKATVKWIQDGDEFFVKKGWEPGRGKRPKVESPSIVAGVPILRANWAAA